MAGILEAKEFGPNQLRPLVTIALPAYQILLANSREVKTAKDLEGLKIRTTGGAMDLMMRSIGGVPVRMAAPEIYKSLTRGTLDGLIFSYQSSVSYDSGKILKSGTEGLNFGTAIFTYSMGEAKFKSLPENVRKVLVEAGEQTTREGCKRFARGLLTGLDQHLAHIFRQRFEFRLPHGIGENRGAEIQAFGARFQDLAEVVGNRTLIGEDQAVERASGK